MKRILLDTHAFLWWIDNKKYSLLGENARKAIANPSNEIYVSAASVWEISIKAGIGALKAPDDTERIVEEKAFTKLPISLFHAQQAGSLPKMCHPGSSREHKDPFDRMLVAQAQSEGMYLLTKDAAIKAYPVKIIDAEK